MLTNGHFNYWTEIVRQSDGRRFGRRQVPQSQLEPAREQLTFLAQRRGKVPADATGFEPHELPHFENESTGEIAALEMSIGSGDNRVARRFALDLFQSFAETAAAELVKSKQIAAGEDILCRTYATPAETQMASSGITAKVQRQPLPLVPGVLDEFRAKAEAVGTIENNDYPVFVTEDVLARAHDLSWKGRALEGGVWILGQLHQQLQPEPEIFGVIHTALEARGTSHERFRIDLSSETFTDLTTQLARRRDRGRMNELALGFHHTHPFLPSVIDGKESCPDCPLRPTCDLSSSFFSQTDAQFHMAIFGRSPYAVQFVLGLSPREEFDLRMFCLDGGKFRQRGYYKLKEIPNL